VKIKTYYKKGSSTSFKVGSFRIYEIVSPFLLEAGLSRQVQCHGTFFCLIPTFVVSYDALHHGDSHYLETGMLVSSTTLQNIFMVHNTPIINENNQDYFGFAAHLPSFDSR
jgi:hypothetical protein